MTDSANSNKGMSQPPLLRAVDLAKSFGPKVVLDGISLEVHHGETLSILGKSGTGKSVLLKLIAKLLDPDRGKIFYGDADLGEMTDLELVQVRKRMGFLFQGAALFDSMTVGENLELLLERHTAMTQAQREERIHRSLSLVDLDDVIDTMPSELSGGMKKRAGLARSIVLEPELILYDEPTTGLDPLTASTIAKLIVSLQLQLGVASIVVTHDLPTAFTVTDRAIILNEGHKVYDGTMEGLADNSDPFLREYVGASTMDRAHRAEIEAEFKKRPVETSRPEQVAKV